MRRSTTGSVAALASPVGGEARETPVIPAGSLIINEDNSHFFGSRPPEDMTRTGLVAWVDGYAGTRVTHLFLSPNSMRASFRSATREAIWDPVDGIEPKGLWPQNARRLHEAGLDPYAVWIARARERGLKVWLSMRMNDVHSVDVPASFMHSGFWRNHPELRRVPGGTVQPWTNQALNYAHAAVREHHAAFLRELLERYDPDGLELDWMRFPLHLTPGREREESPLLDSFMKDARDLTQRWGKQRGHAIHLGVRVTAHPDASAGLGLDAVRWAREGWVDLMVVGPFWRSADFDLPLEIWKERLGPAGERVAVIPGFEHNLRAWLTGATLPNTLATLRGFAAGVQQRGAESLYLFNWMDRQTRPVSAEDYDELLRLGLSPAALSGRPQRVPVTFRDTVPDGFPDGTQLPIDAARGGKVRVFAGAPDPSRRAWVAVGIGPGDEVAAARLTVKLNGRTLAPAEDARQPAMLGGAVRGLQFEAEPGVARAGYNEIEIARASTTAVPPIVWVELQLTGR